jgi:hypothetical protein
VETGDVHVALPSLGSQGAQRIEAKVGVGFDPPEAEITMLVEEMLWAGAWSVPGS